MKSEVLQKRNSLVAVLLFVGLFAIQGIAKDEYYYLHEDFSVESVDMVQDTCPYEIDDAGEICCDTSGCGPAFDPGVIRETVAPTGGTGNYVYMWLISRLVFNPDGSQSWTPPEAIRNIDGTLYAGRDYAPGPLDEPIRLRRCVSTQECLDAGYGFFKETDIVTIWVDDCNCEPDSGGEIGKDQSTCLPFLDPAQLNSISPAVPADPTDQIIYRWYFSFANTPYPNASWMRIRGANDENYDPPVTDRDIYYIREAINPYCPDSPAVSNVVEIIIGGDFSLMENTNDVDCPGNNNGSADIFVSNGNGPFEIIWSNSSTDFSITNLSPGIYEYTVTDAVDCPKTGSVEINEPDAIEINGIVTNTTCEGGNDGQIDITVEGGTGNYTFQWDNGLLATEDQSGLEAGLYCVTVSDANQCEASTCLEVMEPIGIEISANIKDADCFEGNDGSIFLNITGGTAPYSYNWDNGLPNTPNPENLSSGTYCVTVTDANGCQANDCVEVSEPTDIEITGQVTDADCAGASTGSVQITVSGGTSGYSYSWTDDLSNGPILSNVPAGEYCVTVTDANNCEKEACFNIGEAEALEITGNTEDVSCPAGNDGSVIVSVTGGTGSYTYAWSGTNQVTAEITGLSAGEYCLTVTDENGCTAEDCFTIAAPDELQITGIVSDILCNGEETGAIDITVTGGTPAYGYNWDIPSTVEDPINLPAGTYCVTVTDANNCQADACFELEETEDLQIDAEIQDIDCFGNENGSIILNVSGGTPAYVYNWDNDLPQESEQSDLGPGQYCVTVTDQNECESSKCFDVKEPPSIGITARVIDVNCFGESNGAIILTVVGGTGTYRYDWGNGTLPNEPEVTNLMAGVYCVTVTDENGCKADQCFMINEPAKLELSAELNHPNCTNGSDGSINLTVSGGTPSYTYSWDIPSNEEDPSGLTAGTYCVTVTNDNNCIAEDCFTLTDPEELIISGIPTDVQCPGEANGEIDLSIQGGTPEYSILWSDGSQNEDRSGLESGTYCVTVTDENGCTADACFDVDAPEDLSIVGEITDVSCFGDEDGSISVTVSGGTPAYSFNWDNNLDNSAIQTGLAVGTYCLTVVDANECEANACFEIEGPDEIDINGEVTDLDCNGSKDGAIDLTVLGGTAPYFYDWDNNLSSDEDQDNLPAGTYCVTVYDANNCSADACFTITEPDVLVVEGEVENADCAGASTGSITTNVTGGTPAYVYAWDNNLPSTPNQENLEPGRYCVTVTDANGCSDKACFEVEAPEELIISGMAMDVLCAGDDNGMIDLTIFGGTTPYDYNWSSGLDNTEDQFNLRGGVYCVTVTDALGCSDEACFEIQENDPLRVSASIVNVDCFGDESGSIDLTVSGGTVDWYTFQWDNGLPPTEDQTGLGAGIYCVTVTDDNGCVVEDCFQIMEPHPIDIEGHVDNVSCPGDKDGSISLHVNGGTPEYHYEWSNGSNSAFIENLEPGTYCVTVIDENACEASECFDIEEPKELEIEAEIENIDCYNNKNGTINLTVTGGTSPFEFRWDNFLPPTEDQENLQPGTYCVTVTDANGCIVEDCFEISQPMSIGITAQVIDVQCGGEENGSIDILIVGGVNPFSFEWSTGDETEDLTNIGPGTYCVTATDANGCTEEACFEIDEPDALIVSGTVEGIDCHDDQNGSIDLEVSGGTAPYNYNWSGNLPASQDQKNLGSGIYCVTVTDDNDCTFENCFEIQDVDPIMISAQITEPDCHGDQTGAIDLTVSGGTPTYSYNWNNGLPGTQDQSGLSAGTYCVTVTDKNECFATECYEIEENDPLEVVADIDHPSCADSHDGSIDLTVTGGTVDWYTFQWDNGLPPTEDQNGLSAGTYCVTVIDDNGCIVEDCYTLEAPDVIVITGKETDVSCYNGSDGSIILEVSGGTAPYSYDWNNNLPDQANQTGLPAGTFCVTVTDANGCTSENCFIIEEPNPLNISGTVQDALCLGDDSGSISTSVSGGTAPYSYTWSNNLPSTADQSNLEAGTYCVTVTDKNDCDESTCFTIEEGEAIEIDADITNPLCFGDPTGAIDLTVNGGEAPYSYNWDNSLPGQQDQTGLTAGNYCVTVTDNQGCQASDCFKVNNPPELRGKLVVSEPKCGEDNGTATAEVNGGTGDYRYEWSRNNNGTNSVSGLPEGIISVTITDDNDCQLVLSKELKGSNALQCRAYVVQMIGSRNGEDGIVDVDVSGGTGNYSFLWDLNGSTSNNKQVSGLSAGTYTVEVTDENNCGCTSEVTLLNPAKVGDFVWNDLNGNGIQDIGEPGVRNIGVQISGSDVNGNAVNETTTTDADGYYHFNVKPGTYSIHFDAPGSYFFTIQNNGAEDEDSDADANGDTDSFVLGEGVYRSDIDAGLSKNARVGDFVWLDVDQDGIQDADENGVSGVIVRLIQAGTDGAFGTADDIVIATTTTDINGMYMFSNLTPGVYQLIFDVNSLPPNSTFTAAKVGTNDKDSDVVGVNGETDIFTLLSGDNLTDLDAGIRDNCSQLTGGGEIAGDEEGCSPSFNGTLIDNISAPGSGQYEYRWYESFDNQPFDINSPEWRLISGANGPTYDPGRIIYSTYFVRVAREMGCEDTDFVPSNIAFKEVIGCDNECDNVVYAGLIGFSEIECDPFDPQEIVNVQFPSGGSAGDIEYLWMMSTDDPPTPNTIWIPIQNSNTPNYDPGFISESTNFMRCARREECSNFIETNIVVKRILDDPEAVIENNTASYCVDEETTFMAQEFENIRDYDWVFEGANVTEVSGLNATVRWTTPGVHTIQLTTTDFFGCTNTSEITVEVSNDPQDCPNLRMQITLSASLNHDGEVELEYEAESEMSEVEFVIERTDSENGSFEQMNRNDEYLTAGISETFVSMDYHPAYGYNYYRVRMINEYGTEIASNVAQVLIQEEGQNVFLYPNPLVQSRLTVGALDYFKPGTTIEILNAEGKVLIHEEVDRRSYKEYFYTHGWAEGVYFVRISSPGDRPSPIKFLKFNP